MSEAKNNEPAFPLAVPADFKFAHNGMTLRDYFAGQALAGLLAGNAIYSGRTDNRAALVGDAFAHADAMLAERAKEPSHG